MGLSVVAKRAAATVSCLAILALAACGSADTSLGDGQAGQKPTKIRVSTIPIANLGAFYYGMQNGIFAKHDLEIESIPSSGGSAGIPAMLSGSLEIVYTNYVSAFVAQQQGLPVTLIAENDTNVATGPKDSSGMLVAKGFDTPGSLAGKTIGTAKLNNINMVYSKLWLAKQGVDTAQLKFVELPYPEQLAAVRAGKIDAAFLPEPFLTQGESGGLKVIGYPFRIGVGGSTPLAGFVAQKSWAEKNAAAVDRFRAAMAEAVAEAFQPANRGKLLEAIMAQTKMLRDDAEKIVITTQSAEIDPAALKAMAELLTQAGAIKPGLNVDELIFRG